MGQINIIDGCCCTRDCCNDPYIVAAEKSCDCDEAEELSCACDWHFCYECDNCGAYCACER